MRRVVALTVGGTVLACLAIDDRPLWNTGISGVLVGLATGVRYETHSFPAPPFLAVGLDMAVIRQRGVRRLVGPGYRPDHSPVIEITLPSR